jgi:hypothetical protein
MPAFGSAGLSVTGLASIVYAFLKAIAPFIFCSFFFKANVLHNLKPAYAMNLK